MRNFSFLLSALPSFVATGCLAPSPEAISAAKSAPPPSAEPSKTPGDLSKPLLVWDGDDVNPTAKSWSDCDTKPCTSVAEPLPKVGMNGSTGLEYRVETSKGWAGMGWNFTSWYAAGAADATGRKSLKFALQIIAESPEVGPDIDAIQIGVRCAKAKECARGLTGLKKFEPKATDGQWHEIDIPLDDMKTEKKAIWDPGSVWEITFAGWAPTPKKFVVHLDDIRFE
jgi:hypothetical protein